MCVCVYIYRSQFLRGYKLAYALHLGFRKEKCTLEAGHHTSLDHVTWHVNISLEHHITIYFIKELRSWHQHQSFLSVVRSNKLTSSMIIRYEWCFISQVRLYSYCSGRHLTFNFSSWLCWNLLMVMNWASISDPLTWWI